MRSVAGIGALHLLLAWSGAGLLVALRLVALRPVELLLVAGPAYVAGVAVSMPALIVLAVVGVTVTLPVIVVTAALLGAVGIAVGLVRRGTPAPATADRRAMLVAAGLVALFALYAAYAVWLSPTAWDDANIWSLRAVALFWEGSLSADVFTSPVYAASHQDYPLLQPMLEAATFRAAGSERLQEFHGSLWILFGAAVWTAGWLLARQRIAVMLPVLAALLLAPGVHRNLGIGYADATVACFVALGALACGRWVRNGSSGHLVLGAVFLGAAANTKNEGLLSALIVLAACIAATLATRQRRAVLMAAGAAAITLVMVAPWRLWVAAQGIEGDSLAPLRQSLDPTFLFGERWQAFTYAQEGVLRQLTDQGAFVWLAPAFLVVAVSALTTPRARRLGAYYLGIAVLSVLSLLWIYWQTPANSGWLVDTTADRTVLTTMLVVALGLAHLVSDAVGDDTLADASVAATPAASPVTAARAPRTAA